MSLFRKICSAVMAGIMAMSFVIAVSADEVTDKYVTDPSFVTEDHDEPTLSFDMTDWKDYIEPYNNAGVTFSIDNDNQNAYQGQCISITAVSEGKVDDNTLTYNWECRDKDGNTMFEAEPDPEKKYVSMGVKLNAEKFGLENFNGATIAFKYRIGEEYSGLLMANRIFAAPADADGNRIENAKISTFEVNTTDANNVSAYANGVISVADLTDENAVPAKQLIIMIPVHSKTDGVEVMAIDNLEITLRSGAQIKNLDGYNKTAKTHEGAIEITSKQKTNEVKLDGNDETTSSKVKSIISVVGIVVLAVAVVVAVVFAVIKAKKRFY